MRTIAVHIDNETYDRQKQSLVLDVKLFFILSVCVCKFVLCAVIKLQTQRTTGTQVPKS